MSEELQSQSSRYQQLKQKKEALEKKLNEKYEQLHQICQKVSRKIRWVIATEFLELPFHSRNFFLILGGYTDR